MHENEAGALLIPVFGSDDVPSLPVVENSTIPVSKSGIKEHSLLDDAECTCVNGEYANLDWQPKAVNKSNIRRRRHVQPCYGSDGTLIGYRFKFQGKNCWNVGRRGRGCVWWEGGCGGRGQLCKV